jgi:hypothetical protein
LSAELISNQTSYHTISGEISCEESLVKYFSITSSNELITPPSSTEQLSSSEKRTSLQLIVNRSLPIYEKNISKNYIVLEMEQVPKINVSNNIDRSKERL